MSTSEGIAILDQKLRRKTAKIKFPPKMNAIGHQAWDVVADEPSGIFYIGTRDGLLALDPKTQRVRWFEPRDGDSTGLLSRKPLQLLSLGNDRLLIAFWRGGFQVFDGRTGKNLKILERESNYPRKIKRTADGTIWICCDKRLVVFDEKKCEIEYLINEQPIFRDVLLDRNGQIWLATQKGLLLFDRKTRQVLQKITTRDGLSDNDIHDLAEDKLGRIWISTGLGICLFEPSRRKFHLLGKSDGFIFGRVAQTMRQSADGRIWLSWDDQLLFFQPELVASPQPSQCFLTGLKINERDTLPEVFFEKMGEIRLRPGENALTFSFTAIDLETFGKTNFRCRLEGLQTEWVESGKNRVAAFVNLPAGRYVFRVRPDDAGDDPTWDATLTVVVTNHFWQRAWFKNLMIALALLAVGGISAYYFQKLF